MMAAPPGFVQLVASRTGLHPNVVQAWVNAEGGPSGNPLNIGPGRNYGSTAAAAEATAHLVNTSSYYSGIRQAIKGGNPGAEVAAIKNSPWDAGHYQNGVLDRTFAAAGGGRVPAGGAAYSPQSTIPGVGSQATPAGPTISRGLAMAVNNMNSIMGLSDMPQLAATAAPKISAMPQPGAAPTSGGGRSLQASTGAFHSNPTAYHFLQASPGVDLTHTDPVLLGAANRLGHYLGKPVTVISAYRDTAKQAALYQRYVNSGFDIRYIAAKPGESNHNRGEALDLQIGGVPISRAVQASILAQFGLHTGVPGDLPHTTLSSVSG